MNVAMTIGAGVLGVLGAACASQAVSPLPPKSPPPGAVNSSLEEVVRAARADAVRRTGVTADSLVVVSAESVTWSDGSLGCPQPGMMYTQALVPGYRVRLRGPGGEMDYHASTRGALVLCPAGRALDPVPGAAVTLANARHVAVGSGVTDEDGFYMIPYKYTGKAATFYVSIATPPPAVYTATQPIKLKSNAFVRLDFLVP